MISNCKIKTVPKSQRSNRSLSRSSVLYGQGESVAISFHQDFPRDYVTAIKNRLPAIFKGCNIFYHFVPSFRSGQIRIMNLSEGYWSYLGTQADTISKDEPTMNFQDLPKDFLYVIDHEFGHGIFGRLHEHKHPKFINLLDKMAVYEWAKNVLDWTIQDADYQILTPPKNGDLIMETYYPNSSMHYGFPAEVMKNKKPVFGGEFFTKEDILFNQSLYPLLMPVDPITKESKSIDFEGVVNLFFNYKSLGRRMPKYLFESIADLIGVETNGKEKDIIERIKAKISEKK